MCVREPQFGRLDLLPRIMQLWSLESQVSSLESSSGLSKLS